MIITIMGLRFTYRVSCFSSSLYLIPILHFPPLFSSSLQVPQQDVKGASINFSISSHLGMENILFPYSSSFSLSFSFTSFLLSFWHIYFIHQLAQGMPPLEKSLRKSPWLALAAPKTSHDQFMVIMSHNHTSEQQYPPVKHEN